MSHASTDKYYVPHGTNWPILGSIGLTLLFGGFAASLNGQEFAKYVMVLGALILVFMMFKWFGEVIDESLSGKYNRWVDTSFRMSMGWFIFSEVMFFAAFFGVLFYIRVLSVPWLAGTEDHGLLTHQVLHPNYVGAWPTNGPDALGGPFEPMRAWGIPALNTFILLSSGVTVTLAHWALKAGNNQRLVMWLGITVALGLLFVALQAYEYSEAYTHMGLTLGSGVYGSTFFMLTGFHGLHVTIGVIMLLIMTIRSARRHFTPENHFAFEATAWYWHFVDVVWLGLFIFVYLL